MGQNTPRSEKSNAVSRLSSGDYGDDYQIRGQAQIKFLWTIQRCTPAPLYSLRDDVFPNYKAALDSERGSGRTNRELHQLIDDALTLVSAPNHSETLKHWAERLVPRELPALMRAATENLLDWSKRFNLIGKSTKMSEESEPGMPQPSCPAYFFARSCTLRSRRAGRVSPKKAKPFQRVPVIAIAIALSEEYCWLS